jgi:hypothetical protein
MVVRRRLAPFRWRGDAARSGCVAVLGAVARDRVAVGRTTMPGGAWHDQSGAPGAAQGDTG